jgi:hypothetical protein
MFCYPLRGTNAARFGRLVCQLGLEPLSSSSLSLTLGPPCSSLETRIPVEPFTPIQHAGITLIIPVTAGEISLVLVSFSYVSPAADKSILLKYSLRCGALLAFTSICDPLLFLVFPALEATTTAAAGSSTR